MSIMKSRGWLGQGTTMVSHSDGHRADDDFVLKHDGYNEEDEVEQEHEEAKQLAHPPLAGGNGDDDKQQHEEEQDDGTEKPSTAY